MRIGVFSKLGSSGGSEHRCAELCNAIVRYTSHEAVLLCEQDVNGKILQRLDSRVTIVRNIFKPRPVNLDDVYKVDRLIIVNSDSYSFAKRDYWDGRTDHHAAAVELNRIPQMTFLFNFVVSPAQHLWTIAERCPDVRIVCTNRDFSRHIAESEKHRRIRDLPRTILESPIDPDTVVVDKSPSSQIRIGKHSKSFGYKFNEEHKILVERINRRYGDRVAWDFLGVPSDRAKELEQFKNVTLRPEYSIPVGEYLRNLDVFLFFISWERNEPWSRAVAEAMTSGCPVLATDRAGNRDQVEHENTGYLCKTVDEFEQALVTLIEQPEKIRRLGRNARIAAKRFSSRKVIEHLTEFIDA